MNFTFTNVLLGLGTTLLIYLFVQYIKYFISLTNMKKMFSMISEFILSYDMIKNVLNNKEVDKFRYNQSREILYDFYQKYIKKEDKLKTILIEYVNKKNNTSFEIEDFDNTFLNKDFNNHFIKCLVKCHDELFIGCFYLSVLKNLGYDKIYNLEFEIYMKRFG